ncbi:hypothetical protein Q3A66_20815 [Hymenobacter sp. BT770]|uniref:hypothetical protein n=1 Tax=Hymenobacter sp. BT770 TaxID=2886942 RepID=UPI001D0FD485|nr:hypothetical protein [Hymenobacter sp. BT770]MCC3155515.1 hypothetical protein [Hymenobacter sp. BT770]MDO3417517.1 hypothetical protein [Hymenobacter sp. BT770]
MASLTFFLKNPNGSTSTPIIARLAFHGTKVKIYTGLSVVEPKRWNQAAQLVNTRGYAQADRINDALAALRTRLENCFLEYVAAGTVPTPEQLRQAIEPVPQAPEPVVAVVPMVEAPAEPAQRCWLRSSSGTSISAGASAGPPSRPTSL